MKHIERKLKERIVIRKKILIAALNIAKKDSWNAVTIRKIAESIEYTTSVIYMHFASKEDLLIELADVGFRKLCFSLKKVLLKEKNPQKQLMALSIINWDFAVNQNQLYHLMFDMGYVSSKYAQMGMELTKDIFVKITNMNKVEPIILNWICLKRGSIEFLQNYNRSDVIEQDTKTLYVEFINRFIDSISNKKAYS